LGDFGNCLLFDFQIFAHILAPPFFEDKGKPLRRRKGEQNQIDCRLPYTSAGEAERFFTPDFRPAPAVYGTGFLNLRYHSMHLNFRQSFFKTVCIKKKKSFMHGLV
jgi:hypothetical protein